VFSLGLFIFSFGLMGGLYVALFCLRQIDAKILVAYSSVVHISLVLGGLLSFNY